MSKAYSAFKWMLREMRYIDLGNVIRTMLIIGVIGSVLVLIYQAVFVKVQCYYVVTDYERAGEWNPPFCITGMKWGADERVNACYASYDAAIQQIVKRQYKVCGK